MVFVGPFGLRQIGPLRLIAGLEDITRRVIHRWPPGQRRAARPARGGDGVSVLRPIPARVGLRQHGVRLETGQAGPVTRSGVGCTGGDPLQSNTCWNGCRKSCPAASASGSPSAGPSCANRAFSRSTNPLSNLDAALRVQTRIEEFAKLHRELGTSMIYVITIGRKP